MHNLIFCLQDCWMSVKIPTTFVCSSSIDEILLGVIHEIACIVLECFVCFLCLGFVSFTCCRCRIVVSIYFVYTFLCEPYICFWFSKLVDSHFFGLLLLIL